MSSFETFRNEGGRQVEKKNETFDNKNVYTKSLTKMNDSIDFMCGVAHFGFFFKNIILINKTKVSVDERKTHIDENRNEFPRRVSRTVRLERLRS